MDPKRTRDRYAKRVIESSPSWSPPTYEVGWVGDYPLRLRTGAPKSLPGVVVLPGLRGLSLRNRVRATQRRKGTD